MIYLIKTKLIILPLILLLHSCNISPMYEQVGKSIIIGVMGNAHKNLTSEEINNIEYSFIQAKLGRGKPIIMILENYSQSEYRWVSASNESIETNLKGRVLRTSGLPNNLNIISNLEDLDYSILKYPHSINYLIDFDQPLLLNLFINSVLVNRGETENCFLFETQGIRCIEIVEKFNAESINWKGENTYMLNSQSYQVVSSETSVHPFMPNLIIRFYL